MKKKKNFSAKEKSGSEKKASVKAYANKKRPHKSGGNKKGSSKASGGYKPQENFPDYGKLVQGEIIGNTNGYAFFKSEGREDIFVPASAVNGAMHKDQVVLRITGNRKSGGEGEVVEIVNRGLNNVVGVFNRYDGFSVVVPTDRHIPMDILIPKGKEKKAKHGDIVVARIDDFGNRNNRPKGYVHEVLGSEGGVFLDVLAVVRGNNLYETFPPKVVKEAETFNKIEQADYEKRKDYRNSVTFTIDGEDARDFDDAVSVVKQGANYLLTVHIADVSHYVRPFSALDKEALKRGTSVYFPHMVLPMLPEHLSNGLCSLVEGEDRLTLSVEMVIDKNGKTLSHEIHEGVIRSSARLTYIYVNDVLNGKEIKAGHEHLKPMFFEMRNLAEILYNMRKNRGAVEFDLPESHILVDENGKVSLVEKRERLVSHKIIEEFMLKANETVAEDFVLKKAPFVFRIHENPPEEKVGNLNLFLKNRGLTPIDGEVTPGAISSLLNSLPEEKKSLINKFVLRSMAKAKYYEKNEGHFGLAAEFYCHFTSPIRRYPDLFIHRIIKEKLSGGDVERFTEFAVTAAKISTERERLAECAEREVDDIFKAEFMKEHIGEEFDGVISGVTEFGIFVELNNSVEGLIRTDKLGGYGYEFDDKMLTLSNETVTYTFGEPLKIKVESVEGARINFVLAQ